MNFDNDTGLSVSSVEEIRALVRQEWINAFRMEGAPELNTDPSTPQGQLIDSQTAAIVQKENEILFLANQFNPLTAQGIWQDALAQIYFISRQPAIASTAVCTCSGRAGTSIRQGVIIQNILNGTQWQAIESGTIPDTGSIDLQFQCTQTGAIAASAGTLTQIITIVPGWDAVANHEAATTGRLQESQGAFELRRYQSVALNSRSSLASVYGRVGQVKGVLSLYCVDNKQDQPIKIDSVTLIGHSVFISVTGGDDLEIAKAIYNSISAGCAFNGNTSVTVTDDITGAQSVITFDRPSNLQVGIKVTLRDSDDLPSDATKLVQDAVYNNFYALTDEIQAGRPLVRVSQGSDVFSSRFYPSIVNAGVNYILNVELTTDLTGENWEQFIHIPINLNPVLTTENIQVVIQTYEI